MKNEEGEVNNNNKSQGVDSSTKLATSEETEKKNEKEIEDAKKKDNS